MWPDVAQVLRRHAEALLHIGPCIAGCHASPHLYVSCAPQRPPTFDCTLPPHPCLQASR